MCELLATCSALIEHAYRKHNTKSLKVNMMDGVCVRGKHKMVEKEPDQKRGKKAKKLNCYCYQFAHSLGDETAKEIKKSVHCKQ